VSSILSSIAVGVALPQEIGQAAVCRLYRMELTWLLGYRGLAMERRLTVILAADLVGFSHLMEIDEERTHAALQTCYSLMQAVVSKHQGRIFAVAGDSFLAEFASPVEATRAGVEFQLQVAETTFDLPDELGLMFRLGINLGDVIVDGGNLFGDGVNIAVRLEGLAEPGGLCLSGNIYEQVGPRLPLQYEDIGPQVLKNIARPVRAYRVSLRSDAATSLLITATSSFSANWLVPRLRSFRSAHPELDVELRAMSRVVDFNREPFDVGIREGNGNWAGLKAFPLMAREFVPFCSPGFLEAVGAINEPKDLLRLPLIDWKDDWWRDWFAAAGIFDPKPVFSPNLYCDTQLAIARAAMSDQGVALLTPMLFENEIGSGRLVRLFELAGHRGRFWLVYPEAREHLPKIAAFRDWVLDQVRDEGAEAGA